MKKIILIGINAPNKVFNCVSDAAKFCNIKYSDFLLFMARNNPVSGSDGNMYYLDYLVEEKE